MYTYIRGGFPSHKKWHQPFEASLGFPQTSHWLLDIAIICDLVVCFITQ